MMKNFEDFGCNMGIGEYDAMLLYSIIGDSCEVKRSARSSKPSKKLATIAITDRPTAVEIDDVKITAELKGNAEVIVTGQYGFHKTDTILWSGNDWRNKLLVGDTYLDFYVKASGNDVILVINEV